MCLNTYSSAGGTAEAVVPLGGGASLEEVGHGGVGLDTLFLDHR